MTKDDKASSESLRLILVVFLGGCTFSEISALRFLGREKGKREQKGENRSPWDLGDKGSTQEGPWVPLAVVLLWAEWQEALFRLVGQAVTQV